MTFTDALRAELLKIRTLRSLPVQLAAVILATAGVTALSTASLPAAERSAPGFDPLYLSFSGVLFGQVAAICFGAGVVAAEYRPRGLRISLTAVPRRGRLHAARLTAAASLSLVTAAVGACASFAVAQVTLGSDAPAPGDGSVARALVGCTLYLTLITVLAAGLTTWLRSGRATMGILIPFVLVASFVVGDVSHGGTVVDFFPDRAGQQILLQHPDGPIGPWAGMLVMTGWAALAAAVGGTALHRRDG